MDSTAPVAVIGYACRLPGGARPADFWRLLAEGRNAVGEVPAGRWGRAGEQTAGAARLGAFIGDPSMFDAEFFEISPREAAAMDPQQRLVLELGWEALEHAGVVPADLSGSRTGVFVGAALDDYAVLRARLGPAAISAHTTTGTLRAMIANRLSRLLDARGPSQIVDTGQSSALVAIHLACESLRRGESTAALAGGVNLNLAPDTALALAAAGALSPDGRCHTFDARANGYVRGEGGVLVLLKTLERAEADGDPVRCVIRGGAVNTGTAAAGPTVPDPEAQREVIELAHTRAGTAAADVHYVELHGTGTPVGDPVEAAALGAALGGRRPADRPLRVGSVKTNIGHLEAAGGAAGLLKVILALEHEVLPANLDFATPNPAIPLDRLSLRIQRDLEPWPAGGPTRLAGVSSFGIGGTNAHLVVEEAPRRAFPPADVTPMAPTAPVLWSLSGHSPDALRGQAALLHAHLTEHAELAPADVGWSLLNHRTAFAHRAAVLGRERDILLRGLAAAAEGRADAALVEGVAGAKADAVFVLPGRLPRRIEAYVRLLDEAPAFAECFAQCDIAFRQHAEFSLVAVLRGEADAPAPDQADVAPSLSFALGVSLAELWRAYGVQPGALVGEGVGEIAAACAAGALPLEDGARIVLQGAARLDWTSFAADFPTLLRDGHTAFVGLGEDPEAAARIRLAAERTGAPIRVLDGLDHDGDGLEGFLRALAAAHVNGIAIGHESLFVSCDARRVDLPTYAFQRRRHWLPEAQAPSAELVPWVLSAADESDLAAQAQRLAATAAGLRPQDIGLSSASADGGLEQRAVVLGHDHDELLEGLRALSEGGTRASLIRGRAMPQGPVFVFSGEGGQWNGMGRRLMDVSPAFAQRMEQCAQALDPHTGWSLAAVIRGDADAPSPERVDVGQPALFAVCVSLAALWESYGVRPAAVVGHSRGEIAAACVAGALSLDDAAALIVARGRVLAGSDLAGRGAMAWVALTPDQARERLLDGLELAAINGPASVVVAGDPAPLAAFLGACEAEGVRTRPGTAGYASHTAQMDAVGDELAAATASLAPLPATVPFYSTVTGALMDAELPDAAYWGRNLRQTVLFDAAVRSLLGAGFRHFIEVSPHPVLLGAIEQTAQELRVAVAAGPTLTRDADDRARVLTSLATAYANGAEVAWTGVFADSDARVIDLSTTPTEPGAGPAAAPARPRDLRRRLARLPGSEERARLAADLVRAEVAAALGHDRPDTVDLHRTFKQLGLDSVIGVDLRNRLNQATGLELTTTLVFDHPRPAAVVSHLLDLLGPGPVTGPEAASGAALGEDAIGGHLIDEDAIDGLDVADLISLLREGTQS